MSYTRDKIDDLMQKHQPAMYGRLFDQVEHPVVLDCGGHIGFFAEYALERGASRVVSVEPDARNVEEYQARLGDRAEVLVGALCDDPTYESPARIYYGYHNQASSLIDGYTHTQSEGNLADLISFRQLVQSVKPDLIKIDIEGSEHLIDFSGLPDSVRGLAMEVHWLRLDRPQFNETAHEQLIGQGFHTVVSFYAESKKCHVPVYIR